jgi:hypothetical protein
MVPGTLQCYCSFMRISPCTRLLQAIVALLGTSLLAVSCSRTDLLVDASVDVNADVCAVKGAACDATTPCCAGTCRAGTCPPRLALVGDPGAHSETLLAEFLAKNADVTRIHTSGAPLSLLNASSLAPFDVIILEHLTRVYSATESAALFAWVNAGGGIFSLTGYVINDDDVKRPNSLLAPFGIQYTNQASACVQEAILDTGSPVTEGISPLIFCNGYHVDDSDQVGGTDLTLVMSDDAPVLISQQRSHGRVLVWGDDWLAFDDQFDDNTQRFWQQSLQWLGVP